MEQYSPEWWAARAGKLTASSAAVIMGGLDTQGLKDLVRTVAFERLYGVDDEDRYESPAMKRGKRLEAQAADWYTFTADATDVEQPGLIVHPAIPFVAASPDRLRRDRTIEIKCPLHKAFIDVLLSRKVPSEYRWQAAWQMWCAGLRQCDFVVWHPKASGIVIPYSVPDEDFERMTDRAWHVESLVRELLERIANNQKVTA